MHRPKRYHALIRHLEAAIVASDRVPGVPYVILEMGTCRCASALDMIQRAKMIGRDVCYYGFDLFEDATTETNDREHNIKQALPYAAAHDRLLPTGAEFRLFKGDSRETLPAAAGHMRLVDFVFIDGGHSVETIRSDWEWIRRMIHRRSVVIFDDYYLTREDIGCKTLIDELRHDETRRASPWVVEILGPAEWYPTTGPMTMVKVTLPQEDDDDG